MQYLFLQGLSWNGILKCKNKPIMIIRYLPLINKKS